MNANTIKGLKPQQYAEALLEHYAEPGTAIMPAHRPDRSVFDPRNRLLDILCDAIHTSASARTTMELPPMQLIHDNTDTIAAVLPDLNTTTSAGDPVCIITLSIPEDMQRRLLGPMAKFERGLN